MQKLTKKYDDGTFGVADDLPVGENSHSFKEMLINTLGSFEHDNFSFTDRELEMLKQFASVYAEERRCDATNNPIVAVQVNRKRIVPADYGDERCILIIDDGKYTTVSDSDELIQYLIAKEDDYFTTEVVVEGQECSEFVLNTERYEKVLESFVEDGYDGEEERHPSNSDMKFRIIYQVDSWENVAYFFTRAEAEKYVKYQSHNLSRPRVFTLYAGYSNQGDYPTFLHMLKRLGEHLLATGQDNVRG